MTRRRARPEQTLQRAELDHLARRAVPNGGWRSRVEARILKSQVVIAGVPDIVVLHGGKAYGLELKAEGGRLSPGQIETQQRMREGGATVATTTGIDQAIAQLVEWELLR